MFKSFHLPWFKKQPQALSPSEVPKSFTISGEDKHLYKVSMENTYADFVDVDYKKLSYAEAAALSKHKTQTSQITSAPILGVAQENVKPVSRSQLVRMGSPELEDEVIQEKFKRNNYFLKNKVYKQSDRNPKKKAV